MTQSQIGTNSLFCNECGVTCKWNIWSSFKKDTVAGVPTEQYRFNSTNPRCVLFIVLTKQLTEAIIGLKLLAQT